MEDGLRANDHETLKRRPPTKRPELRTVVSMGLVLMTGLVLSLLLHRELERHERERLQTELAGRAQAYAVALQGVIDSHAEVVQSVGSYLDGSENVTRAEFHRFCKMPFLRHPNLHAMEWIPRVPHARREAFEAGAREDGQPGFRITERVGHDAPVPAARRDEYFPMYYLEPPQRHDSAMGLDLAAEPALRPLLEKARNTGGLTASPCVVGHLPLEGEPAFRLVLPIYEDGVVPESLEDRRRALAGFAVSVTHIAGMVEEVLGGQKFSGLDVYLIDEALPAGERLLHVHTSRSRSGPLEVPAALDDPVPLEERVRLGVADRQWTLIARPAPAFMAEFSHWEDKALPAVVLALFVLGAFALGTIMCAARRRRESEENYRGLFESSRDAIMTMGPPSWMFTSGNAAAVKMFRAQSEADFISYAPWEVSPEKQANGRASVEIAPELIETALREGSVFFEWTHRRIDGEEFPATVLLGRVGSGDGVFLQATVRDSTESKKAEEQREEARALLQKVVDGLPDQLMKINLDYTIALANRRARENWGLTSPELVGMKCHEVSHGCFMPCTSGEHPCPMEEVLRTKGVVTLEHLHHNAAGDEMPVELVAAPIFDENGEVIQILESVRDITERKRAEKALRESEEEFRSLAEAMPQIVWITRADGWNIYFNQQWVDYTGLTLEESCGHGWNTPFHPDDRQRAWDAWQNAVQNNGTYSLECRLRRFDGGYRWWLIRGVPILNKRGEILKWFGTCTDIEEFKQAGAEMERLARFPSENPNPVLRVSAKGVLEYANEAAELFRSTMGADVGSKINAEWQARIDEAVGKAHPVDLELHAGDRIFAATLAPVTGLDYVNVYARDITERKEAEAAAAREQERLQFIFDALPIGISLNRTHRDGSEFRLINEAHLQIAGISREEDSPETWRRVNHPDNRDEQDAFRCERDGGRIKHFSVDKRYIHPDGRMVWVAFSRQRKMLDDGGFEDLCTVVDITQRKQAEEKIKIFSRAVAEAYDSIVLTDPHGNITYLNESAVKTFGYSPEEVAKVNVSQLCADPQDAMRIIKAMGTKGTWSGEVIQIRKNKEIFPATLSTSLFKDNAGNPTGMMGVFRDITERKQAEMALRDSEQRFRTLFEGAVEGILIADVASRSLEYANPAICEMLGYTAEELTTMAVQDIHPAADLPAVFAAFEAQAHGELRLASDLPCLRKDGTVLIADINAAPVELDGRPRIVAFFTDVTERKEAEAERQRLERQLREGQRLASIGVLAGGIGHEFNNILQGITGYCEIMLGELEPQSAHHQNMLEIMTAACHAGELSRELLAFSRQGPLECEGVDLNEVLRSGEALLRQALDETTQLKLQLDPQLKPVFADASQIQKVVLNLVANARDAMPHGGTVILSTMNRTITEEELAGLPNARVGSFACFSVADAGCGMHEEQLAHMFDPFYTTKPVGQGTGLGLAVVYGMVQEHDGWMSVSSKPGRGSVFTVFLPIRNVDTGAGQPAAKGPARRKILLVADDAMAGELLMGLGHDVTLVETAQAAGEAFERKSGAFDLLFMEVMLPDGNGIDLADALLERSPGVPVLLFSGCTDEEVNLGRITARGYRYMKKPFGLNKIMDAVGQAIREG